MKKIILFISVLSIFTLYFNCVRTNTQKEDNVQKSTHVQLVNTIPKEINLSEIDGIWAENTYENANFWIKNDSMYFIEDRKNPLSIKITNDTLITYYGDMTTYDAILKLTTDSLILKNEFGKIIKLYKRR